MTHPPISVSDVETVWRFLALSYPPASADVLFVFGGNDLAVPKHAAELFARGFAPRVLCSGKAGPLTPASFESEADAFAAEMTRLGVPGTSIIREHEATNTGQNVAFGMRELVANHVRVDTALLVAKPFLMRRCVATFGKQYPSVRVIPSPPSGQIESFVDRNWTEFVARLPAELDRLRQYANSGFIVAVQIPDEVAAAAERLRQASTNNAPHR